VARACECKPSGGYSRPTFTLVTYAHVLFGGHLSPLFSDKSYFASTEKVGQALVDEILARGIEVSGPGALRVVIEADLDRPLDPVGYARPTSGGFRPTTKVRLIYERSHCLFRLWAGNEVVSMFPI
jgi:hypothetical protein